MSNSHPILVTVITFNNIVEAQMAKNVLELEGIQCFLENENMNTLYGNALGGVTLKVAGTDLQKAKDILKKKNP